MAEHCCFLGLEQLLSGAGQDISTQAKLQQKTLLAQAGISLIGILCLMEKILNEHVLFRRNKCFFLASSILLFIKIPRSNTSS